MFLCPGAAGQVFQREMKKNTPQAAEYKQLKTRQAKADFRKQWAQMKLEAAKKSAVKQQKHIITEGIEGQYMSFKRVWDMEGSDKCGFEVAREFPNQEVAREIPNQAKCQKH